MAATYARQVASEEIPPHLVAQTPLEPGRAAPVSRQWQPPDSSPRTSRLRPRRIAQGWWQAGLCPKTLLHPPALLRRKKKHRNSSLKIPLKSQGQTEKQRQTKESRSSSRRIDCYQDSGDSARGCWRACAWWGRCPFLRRCAVMVLAPKLGIYFYVLWHCKLCQYNF